MRHLPDRREGLDFRIGQVQPIVELGIPDRLQIEDAADGETRIDLGPRHGKRREVAAGRPARDDEATAPPPLLQTAQEHQRRPDLGGDLGEAGLRRQGISHQSHIETVTRRSFGHAGEILARIPDPVAAMDEDEERRILRPALEQVDPGSARPAHRGGRACGGGARETRRSGPANRTVARRCRRRRGCCRRRGSGSRGPSGASRRIATPRCSCGHGGVVAMELGREHPAHIVEGRARHVPAAG